LTKFLNIVVAGIIYATTFAVAASAQFVSDNVYPSDEELFEAFLQGELDYQTYLNLTELFESGIDSSDIYLLDEIPNQNYLIDSNLSNYSGLSSEQIEPFLESGGFGSTVGGAADFFKIRRFQELEENGRGKNQYYLKSSPTSNWSCRARFNEDYEGKSEWTERSLIYRNPGERVRKVAVGNFTARYGLGLIVGYRGKLLSKDSSSSSDSPLFPDYGGFNGLYAEAGRQNDAVKWLFHYDQNRYYRFRAAAVDLIKRYRAFQGEIIASGGIIDNRGTGIKYSYYQLGSSLLYRGRPFSGALELAFPKDILSGFSAAIFEAEYRTKPTALKVSGWHYGREYKNLTGGGRSGYYYNKVTIDTVDFSFSDRRNGQRGVLIEASSAFAEDIPLNFSCALYERNQYERTAKILTSLGFPLSGDSKLRMIYGYSEKNDLGGLLSEHKVRAEYVYHFRRYFFRSYIGYRIDSERNKYLSYLCRIRTSFGKPGTGEIWLNFDKINIQTGRLDYFYGYFREAVNLMKSVELGLKYSYRYSRNYSDQGQSTFLLEAKLEW
jgi:hypothetical protein